jgi:hypothetical protein
MSCERCGGLMVIETFCDLTEEEFRKGIDTTRCLNCGNFEDTIIRINRASSRLPGHCEPRTVGTRRQSANQPRLLEQPIRSEPVIAGYPRGRAPRFPVGAPSTKTRALEAVHVEQPASIVQAKRKCV